MNERQVESKLELIRVTLSDVRREASRRPEMARNLLADVNDDLDCLAGTSESVEFSLLLAVTYTAQKDSNAEAYLIDAEQKANKIEHLPPDLRVRLYEARGDYHRGVDLRLGIARSTYERAKDFAVNHDLKQESARFQLKIISIDLEIDKDSEGENFKTFKRVAKEKACTWTEQLGVWMFHLSSLGEQRRNVRYARSLNSKPDNYFVGLITDFRRNGEKDGPTE